MTETVEDRMIADALALIDGELPRFQQRELINASEVSDLLLDLRLILAPVPAPLNA